MISSRLIITLCSLVLVCTYGFAQEVSRPQNLVPQNAVGIKKGDLNLTIVNNMPFGSDHRAGHNGISNLLHPAQDSTPFAPYYAGFNLEHIFGGDSLSTGNSLSARRTSN